MIRLLKVFWPILVIFALVLIFFYPVWLRGLVPIPADITVGLYYPWLDYKWGYEVGVPVKNNLPSDIVSVHLPFRIFAAEQLRQGQLPLWNNLILSGTPLVGNFQSVVFYPLNIFLFFLSTIDAWTIQIILQPLLAAIFTYLLLRHWGLSKIASLFGGITFAFSGFLLVWLEFNVHGHVTALIPLALFLTDKFLERKKIFWGVFLSITFATQIFAGYPQLTFYTAALVALWAIVRPKVPILLSQRLFNLSKVIFFVVLGGFLSAVQLVPGTELFLFSQRISEGVAGIETKFLPWEQLITIFAPDYFGNPATGNFWGAGNYTNSVGYTGIISMVLATFAFLEIKKKEVKLFFLLAFFSIIFALPTPISTALHSGGLLGATNVTRLLVFLNLAIAALAAFGLDSLNKLRWDKNILRVTYLSGVVLLGVGLGTVAARFWISSFRTQFLDSAEALKIIEYWTGVLGVGIRNLILPIGLVFATAILLILSRWKSLKILTTFGFLFLLSFELFRFGHKYLTFTRQDLVFPKTPAIEFLIDKYKAEGPFRVLGGDVVPMNMFAPYGLETASGYDALYPASYARFLSEANGGSPEQPLGRYGDIKRFDSGLLDIGNVRYILALKRDNKSNPDPTGKPSYLFDLEKFTPVFEDGTVLVLENKDVLPRAFFETNGKVQDADISYLKYSPQHSILSINAPGNGVLVVSDQYYPGWKALVDGKEEEIFPRYEVFRGVGLSAGAHTVEFIYDPESFKIGAKISFATAALLVALVLYEYTKNLRRKTSRKSSA